MTRRSPWFVLVLLWGCGAQPVPSAATGGGGTIGGKADGAGRAGDVLSTDLSIDLATHEARAVVTVAGEARLEAQGLEVRSVNGPEGPLPFEVSEGILSVASTSEGDPVALTIEYSFADRSSGFEGWLPGTGVTFLWPYFCGNLFPCNSEPADGLRFTLAVTGVPEGSTAVYPEHISADAPPYMLALAVGRYRYRELGRTAAGTRVGVYYFWGETEAATRGTQDLVGVFDFLESTYGAYAYGDDVASVSARWGEGAVGGMEHHPYWHVASAAMDDAETHAHEAAHGWYGNGVRIRCWEDFVLSEGVTSYLAARALSHVGGETARQAVWRDYRARLRSAVSEGDTPAWPEDACNSIELLHHPVWSDIPYMKGAFFMRAVEQQVGIEALDAVLARFYGEHVGGEAAGMRDLIDAIAEDTGFDAAALAEAWLRQTGIPDGG